jgi:hypothetical protein
MGDWLGTGTIAPYLRRYRPFTKARAFVRSLGLKSGAQWGDYCASGKKPSDIPADPRGAYARADWAGMGDWLGTGRVATQSREYRSFEKARTLARGLGLRSEHEWRRYCASGKIPADIPRTPAIVYAEDGWAGFGDWLATGNIAPRLHRYRPFKQARAFVRALGLKSRTEWNQYCKSGKKPDDIPVKPDRTYAKAGWAGMGDWLGTDNVAN